MALVAVRNGAPGLDQPIAKYWNAYGNRGKERTTLRHVLTHQAGQPRFPAEAAHLDLLDDAGLRESPAGAAPEAGSSVAEPTKTVSGGSGEEPRIVAVRQASYGFCPLISFSMALA